MQLQTFNIFDREYTSNTSYAAAQAAIEAGMPNFMAAFRAGGFNPVAGSLATLYPSRYTGAVVQNIENRCFCCEFSDMILMVGFNITASQSGSLIKIREWSTSASATNYYFKVYIIEKSTNLIKSYASLNYVYATGSDKYAMTDIVVINGKYLKFVATYNSSIKCDGINNISVLFLNRSTVNSVVLVGGQFLNNNTNSSGFYVLNTLVNGSSSRWRFSYTYDIAITENRDYILSIDANAMLYEIYDIFNVIYPRYSFLYINKYNSFIRNIMVNVMQAVDIDEYFFIGGLALKLPEVDT